jgi:hypothetical protein
MQREVLLVFVYTSITSACVIMYTWVVCLALILRQLALKPHAASAAAGFAAAAAATAAVTFGVCRMVAGGWSSVAADPFMQVVPVLHTTLLLCTKITQQVNRRLVSAQHSTQWRQCLFCKKFDSMQGMHWG